MEASLFPRRPDYLLKVRGMSMRTPASWTATCSRCRRRKEAKNGQIVVARLGDEVTVKRFRRSRGAHRAAAREPRLRADRRRPAAMRFEIEGLAVGLIRNNMLM